MGFNKGEWSELYSIFYIMDNPKLNIVDYEFNIIDNTTFDVKSIISSDEGATEFIINDDEIIQILNDVTIAIPLREITSILPVFFEKIKSSKGKAAFSIPEIETWISKNNISTNFKSSSRKKEDIILLNFDNRMNRKQKLAYSIKSQIGSPATILNASNHTNFRYEVTNVSKAYIKKINSISGDKKLVDRMKLLLKVGANIKFDKVTSDKFDKNLRMIDSLLPEALGEILLKSYELGEKELKKLFTEVSVYSEKEIANKKLQDFLLAASFGMFPSKEWNGEYTVKGGIIIVTKNSRVYVLDKVYFEEQVKKYLVNETKLDSPSSTRYKMLELYEEKGKVYFTLNLQVRYK